MSPVAALLLIATAAEPPILDVRTVDASVSAMNGQVIRVQGWLGRCERFGCPLYPDEAGAVASANYSQTWRIKPRPERPPVLAIGGDDDFDRRAAAFQRGFVVIEGRVDSGCRVNICTDRAPDILPTSIRPAPSHLSEER